MDQRWNQLGEIIVNHSVSVQPGERVMIAMHEIDTLPLVQGAYQAAVKAGGLVQVQFLSETLRHRLLEHGNMDQISWVPEIEAFGMEWADVYLGFRGAHNLYELADIPPERLSASQKANGKISSLRWDKTRWCLVRVPNASFAQQARTDEERMMEMFFGACLIDWKKESQEWRRIASVLNKGKQIRIRGTKTDLTFSVAGRTWLAGDGKINMPDGEIYTAPIHETVEGTIYFEFPGVLGGRIVPDIQLTWKRGHLVEAISSENQDFLQSILHSDGGSGFIGEFAFGVNPSINMFTTDILIDEKIGGTIHIAMGRSYPECGGTNQSAIHWDIVKDTRQDCEIYLDGQMIFRDGKILI